MKMTSRLRLRPPAIAQGISVIASSPGPPASQTIGSGFETAALEGTIATERLIVFPSGWARSSGTKSLPQRAVFSSGIGVGGLGQEPGAYLAAGAAPATEPMP